MGFFDGFADGFFWVTAVVVTKLAQQWMKLGAPTL